MKTMLKVALGIVLGVVILIVGCGLLISSGVDDAEEERDATAISRQQFRSVKTGTPRREVIDKFGQPSDRQTFENEIEGLGSSRGSCIYYNEKGQELFEGATFQLCFENGRLQSKNAY